MKRRQSRHTRPLLGTLLMLGVFFILASVDHSEGEGQRRQREAAALPPTLGLDQGLIEIDTPDFALKLVKASQTVAELQPKGAGGFDFTPADLLEARSADGYHHLGDVTLRVRSRGSDAWTDYSTAAARKPVNTLPASGDTLAAADLTPTLPPDCPLAVTRTWALEGGRLALRITLKNNSDQAVEIGALGLPMIFNNILSRRSLEQAHETCSFFDPYIGLDAGYLQVTRLSGRGPALVVVSEGATPFEAYRPLDEPMRRRQTFEGAFEWTVHSRAYAENEWKDAKPWNPPTGTVIPPGEGKSYGVRFLLSPEIREIERTLSENGRPVAVGIPGYILPQDLDARLFLKYGSRVASVKVEPEGSAAVKELPDTDGGWNAYALRGTHLGRARLTVRYEDGLRQSIHYYVTKSAAQAVDDLGRFLMTRQWFSDPEDPFRRSPSVMSYDREVDRVVRQDPRVWIAGLGDEGGSGSWVAAAMKLFGRPDKQEVAKYERFVNQVLWGGIQYSEGERQYGVRKSLFYYEPEDMPEGFYDKTFNWGTWTSWNKEASETVGRSYNYPHAAAVYWSMYRLARNSAGLVTSRPWEWFLERAYRTGPAMAKFAPQHARHGQMEGTIFLLILRDLKREGWTEQAADLEAVMKTRADIWKEKAYPFGSEMAWDSTGQEEVYAWCRHFGFDDKAAVSLNSILGYMPTLPHWGYNGNARRYWDFLYGGKLKRIERQLHHYGSGLNAIPVLTEYRDHPDDFYLLRVGYGGMMGALSNIDRDGFASAAFHSFPSTLKWDAYSGDYGPNFFGHALNTAAYIIDHPEFGWQVFGGNLRVKEDAAVSVTPLDSFRKRVYVAPYGLWLTLEAGTFEAVEIDTRSRTVRLGLAGATEHTAEARLCIEQPAEIEGVGGFSPDPSLNLERGAYVVPLKAGTTWIKLLID
jgi:hypothetical protein